MFIGWACTILHIILHLIILHSLVSSEICCGHLFSVANLRCTPKNGELRSVTQDSSTKRFTIHHLRKNSGDESKKSDVEESGIVYNREGLPVDTAKTVVRGFKS